MSRPPGHQKRASGPRSNKKRPAVPARTVELEIAEIGAQGDGIARLGAEIVFVPYTAAGDRVLARIEGRRGDGLAAALVEVLAPGPGRAQPPCPHFGRCGGCALQHLTDESYAAWKRGVLVTQLGRAGLADAPVGELVRVVPGTRRRAAFAFVRRRSDVLAGFHARASHAVVDVESCRLIDPALEALLPPLRVLLAAVVSEGAGDLVAILGDNGIDLLIEAEAKLDLAQREALAAFAERHDLARLSWRQPGGQVEPVARRRPATLRFGGIAVEPPPGAFLQPTREGETALTERVLAAVGPLAPVADLFSGSGTFSLPLAAGGRAVHAVEGEEAPLRALEAAANQAGLTVTAENRDLARRPLLTGELARFNALVFDPPRAGAAALAEQLAVAGPPVVVAVSCNPATLARDLKTLTGGGYVIESLTPIDQFPWSAHLETVAVLRRRPT